MISEIRSSWSGGFLYLNRRTMPGSWHSAVLGLELIELRGYRSEFTTGKAFYSCSILHFLTY